MTCGEAILEKQKKNLQSPFYGHKKTRRSGFFRKLLSAEAETN
jgi:hypothetical protein